MSQEKILLGHVCQTSRNANSLLTCSSFCVPMGARRGYLFHIYVVRRGVAAHNPADVFLGNFPARRARNMVNRKFVVDLFVFLCSNGGIGSLFFHMFYCPPGVAAHNRRAFFCNFSARRARVPQIVNGWCFPSVIPGDK